MVLFLKQFVDFTATSEFRDRLKMVPADKKVTLARALQYVCASHVCSAQGCQKRASDSLEQVAEVNKRVARGSYAA